MNSKINSTPINENPCNDIENSYAIVTSNRRQGLVPTEDFTNVTFEDVVPEYWNVEGSKFARWNLVPIPDQFRKVPEYPLEEEIIDPVDMRRRPYMLIDPREQRVVGQRCPDQFGEFSGCVYIFDNYYLPLIFTVSYFDDQGFPTPQNILLIDNNIEADILAVRESDIDVLSTEFGKNIEDIRRNCFITLCNEEYDAQCTQYFNNLSIEDRKRIVNEHCNVNDWKVNLCSGLCQNDPDLRNDCTAAHTLKCSNLRPDNAGELRETCACFYSQEIYNQQISRLQQALDRFEGGRYDQLRQIVNFIENTSSNNQRKCIFNECANAPFRGSYDRVVCSDFYSCFQDITLDIGADIGETELNLLNECIIQRRQDDGIPDDGTIVPPGEDNTGNDSTTPTSTRNLIIWSVVIIIAIVAIAVIIYFIYSRIQRSRRQVNGRK